MRTFSVSNGMGAIAVIAAAAIALAACGGGGGLNEDEAAGLRGELEAAEAAAAAALAAQKAAEDQAAADKAAREAAEAAAAAARTAQETAEAEAVAALRAQETAEAAQEAAERAQEAAEAAQIAAEGERDAKIAEAAEAARMAKEAADRAAQAARDLADAQDAKEAAETAQDAALAAQKDAEDARDRAIAAEREAQRQLQAAQQAASAEEQARLAAERAREQAQMEAEEAQQQVDQASARTVLLGLGGLDAASASTIGTDDPVVTPSYRAAASVTGTPGVTFVNSTTGSQGRWFRTSFSHRGESFVDRMDVYTDVDAAASIAFKDSRYNVDNAIVDAEGDIIARLGITGARDDVAGSGFPRSSGPPRSYDLTSRGMTMTEFSAVQAGLEVDRDTDGDFDAADRNTQAFRDALAALGISLSQYNSYVNDRSFRDTDLYPEQWNAVVSGTLGGASGTYVCSSATRTTSCTVQNRGSDLNFVGPWTYRPSNGTVRVTVEDSTYMHFGWWSRQTISDGSWSFRTFHGDGDDSGSVVELAEITGGNDVSGTATYQGPAVGYYAIYQPLGGQSGHGDFSATASLTADFDAGTNGELRGTIDQFQGHADWSLTLNRADIATVGDGAGATDTTDGVSWKIGDRTTDGGSWSANFYSNLVEDDPSTSATENARNGVVPSGIAGTFSAEFQDTQGADIGRMTGAFGAHCRTGC